MLRIVFFLLISLGAQAKEAEFVHHPQPKDPIFLKASQYEDFKKLLTQPPLKGDVRQAADDKEILRLQSVRTPEMCQQAKDEVLISLESLFGSPKGTVSPEDAKKLTEFFSQIRNDGDFYIKKMKIDFPRQRPFLAVDGAIPCVAKEVTGAYPSGHATLSRLYALILTDLYPANQKELEERANQIALNRVVSGMHFPTDIAAGKILGEAIFKELKKSKKYQDHFKQIQNTLAKSDRK